jgi:DNA-binding transcriptional LysR family regulator
MMQVTLRRFREIARLGSIRAAADQLCVTPSALSRDLANLEQQLGVAMFDRHARGMVLTPAGEIYLNHARDVLLGVDRMQSELEALLNLRRGKVSVLSVEGFATDFLTSAIVDFRATHPDLIFNVQIAETDAVVAGVVHGDAHIGLAFNPQPKSGLRFAHRLKSPLLAVMAPDHAMASAKRLLLSQLSQQKLALPDVSFGVRRLIDLQCRIGKVCLEPVLESNSLAVLRGFARHGGGITLLSHMSIQTELRAGQLVGIPVDDKLLRQGCIDVCVLADRSLPLGAAAFLDHLRG